MGKFKRTPRLQDDKIEEQDGKDLSTRREVAYRAIQNDAELCKILASVIHTTGYKHCDKILWKKYDESGELFSERDPLTFINDFLGWAGQDDVRPTLAPHLEQIFELQPSPRLTSCIPKRRPITYAELNPSAVNKSTFYTSIPIRKCSRLDKPFPPPHLYISEDDTIFKRNMKFVLERDIPDARKWRKLIFHLKDENLLEHDLDPSSSVVFEDEHGPVAVVIRNACTHDGVVQFLDNSIKKVVDMQYSIRKQDGSHLSQMGLSVGSVSHSSLGWVRHTSREKPNDLKHQDIDREASSAFAVFWGLARSLLPDRVIADTEAFIQRIGPELRTDGNKTMDIDPRGCGARLIQLANQEQDFEFHHAQVAPPAAVMGENYCRFVHYEHQPHTWAMSFTASRETDSTAASHEFGGHFYISSYGIRVQAAPNTLIAWRPSDWHATSLYRINPKDPRHGYHQRGLAFVSGNRLVNAIKKWRLPLLDLDISHSVPETEEEKDLDLLVSQLRRSHCLAQTQEQVRDVLKRYHDWENEVI